MSVLLTVSGVAELRSHIDAEGDNIDPPRSWHSGDCQSVSSGNVMYCTVLQDPGNSFSLLSRLASGSALLGCCGYPQPRVRCTGNVYTRRIPDRMEAVDVVALGV